jgi:hypothetical protein
MDVFKRYLIGLAFILPVFNSFAQDKPIGYWQSHMPYNSAVGIATDGMNMFTICKQSFYTIQTKDGTEMPTYSKVEGMSDVGMQYEAYDAATSTVVLAYTNSNIDLFKDNTFYNIPDLKNKVVSGSKTINHIYTENGFAYLSTDIGIIVIDLGKREIDETYVFYQHNQVVPVKAFVAFGTYYYAATPNGLFRADKNNPELQNFAVWQMMDSTHNLNFLAAAANHLFAGNNKTVFTLDDDTLRLVHSTTTTINHIDAGLDGLWITEYVDTLGRGPIRKMDGNFHFTDSVESIGKAWQVVQSADSVVWVADEIFGLQRRGTDLLLHPYYPQGPNAATCSDIYAYNREIYVTHGGYNDLWLPNNNTAGFSGLKNDKWTVYAADPATHWSIAHDFISVLKNQSDGTIYAGSFQEGLLIIHPDGSSELINSTLFDKSVVTGGYQVAGMAFDNSNNLWLTMYGSKHELFVKTAAGNWDSFYVPFARNIPYAGGPIVVDDNNFKWYVSWNGGANGGGVIVYDDNSTPDIPGDDRTRNLTTGVGYGNLPSNKTLCIAKDKNNDIWVGTDNGIAIINCGGSVFEGCDAQIPIVQYDKYAGYLFAGENVRTIAVDGANRKWVGTDNGVWLLSPDAGKIIYRFTQDNSPLPSNHIQKIAIDPVTGDVYIGTEQGLITYRSTATEGGAANSNVVSFPNPVPSGYSGTIAIKGLVANADVRITDVSGQLVYRTTALGGQAIWNGKDYTGHRPETGVYLIFITNSDGTETYVGKMVFLQ